MLPTPVRLGLADSAAGRGLISGALSYVTVVMPLLEIMYLVQG